MGLSGYMSAHDKPSSEKNQCFRWCSGRWRQVWQGGGVLLFSLKMSQNSIESQPRLIGYDVPVLDASDDSDRSAAAAGRLAAEAIVAASAGGG